MAAWCDGGSCSCWPCWWRARYGATGPAYAGSRALPPTGTDFDYQLGGNRSVPSHVGIVVRDREAAPAAGRYNICYVNGFQTQPNERRFWRKHWGLVLKRDGRAGRRRGLGRVAARHPQRPRSGSKLARIVGRWIDGCARDGYAAVEFDNLDSFVRSRGLVDRRDSKAFARLLVSRAHRAGLAAAQKNRAQWDGRVVGFDFAIAEECARWRECGSYVDHYGRRVLAVEYRGVDFQRACRGWADQISVVRRDVELSGDGVRQWC